MPTSGEVELHRQYLLKVLKQLTKKFQQLKAPGVDFDFDPQGSVLTKSQQEERLSPPAAVDPTLQEVSSGPPEHSPGASEEESQVFRRGSDPSDGPEALVQESAPMGLQPDGQSSVGSTDVGVAVDRLGQAPPGVSLVLDAKVHESLVDAESKHKSRHSPKFSTSILR